MENLKIVDAINWQGKVGQTKDGTPTPPPPPAPPSASRTWMILRYARFQRCWFGHLVCLADCEGSVKKLHPFFLLSVKLQEDLQGFS